MPCLNAALSKGGYSFPIPLSHLLDEVLKVSPAVDRLDSWLVSGQYLSQPEGNLLTFVRLEIGGCTILGQPSLVSKLFFTKLVEGYLEHTSLMVLFLTFTLPQKLLLFQLMVTELIL